MWKQQFYREFMKAIQLLGVYFANEISRNEIELFRGAVLHALTDRSALLFHNHIEEKFRYSYPLIQYKQIDGKATIVCIEEGVEEIGKLFSVCDLTFMLGRRSVKMEVEIIKELEFVVQITTTSCHYSLHNWLPLNSENYKIYKGLLALSDKVAFLQRMLVGNILSFYKGVGEYLESDLTCSITALSELPPISHKGVPMLCFDAEFVCNVTLPDYIGIGKSPSIGFGIVKNKNPLWVAETL